MAAFEEYNLAEEQLKAFSRSSVRAKILLSLKDGETTGGDLAEELEIRSSTLLHSMKELIHLGLVERGKSGYALTNIGRVQSILLHDLLSAITVLEQQKDFWLTHDISDIPESLLVRIGSLGRSELVEGDHAAILRTQEIFVSQLESSKEICGVSPIIIPEYPQAIASAVSKGARVTLILTSAIMDIVAKEERDLLEMLLEKENFSLYRFDGEIRAAFTVTDELLSLGLFRLRGGYDVGADLVFMGEGARAWGMDLFEHYRHQSRHIVDI